MSTIMAMFGKSARYTAVLSLCIGLPGCAVTTVDGRRLSLSSDAFRDYVGTVYRRQSDIATELAIRLDTTDPDSDRYAALEAAELELLLACRGLNQLATQQIEGDTPRGPAALKQSRQAPACERATTHAASLL